MKYESELKFGQSMYLINDIDQVEYKLTRIILERGRLFYELFGPDGDYFEVPKEFAMTKKDIINYGKGIPPPDDPE